MILLYIFNPMTLEHCTIRMCVTMNEYTGIILPFVSEDKLFYSIPLLNVC